MYPGAPLARRRAMPKLRVHAFAVSLDGYGAGPDQGLDDPLGRGGMVLHEWVLTTRHFRQKHGEDGGKTGIDDDFDVRGIVNPGAWILSRHQTGPVGEPWTDDTL